MRRHFGTSKFVRTWIDKIMNVSAMIDAAFTEAARTHASLQDSWIRVSIYLSRVLPLWRMRAPSSGSASASELAR
jgi:hypothetical protein